MMLLLDTNVVSALIRRELDPVVARWFDHQNETQLYISVITIHEMRYGIENLQAGRRRTTLAGAMEDFLVKGFDSRVLDLDFPACWASGEFQARRARMGRPIDLADCFIAGIAASRNAALATRNATDFAGLGLDIINPWTAR